MNDVRKQYIDFFTKRGHAEITSASLVPENDSTTLFTSSGMQPLIPYLLGEAHPAGKRLVNSQACFRAEDIEEVGDNRHTTFFEMLGNWSLGDYSKSEQLPWFFEFLTEVVALDPKRLYVTVFAGDKDQNIERDTRSAGIWKELFKTKNIDAKEIVLGSTENASSLGMQGGRIFYYDVKKNWWSRSGLPADMPPGEPGGPDSEVFYEFDSIIHDESFGEECHPNCDCGRFLEIGNSVFIEYQKSVDGTFKKLPQQNVDFGGGLSRIMAAQKNDPDIFKTDLYLPIISALEKSSGTSYSEATHDFRIIADHITGSIFMVSEGVKPGNKQQNYIARRLIRRAVVRAHLLGIKSQLLSDLVPVVADIYQDSYSFIDKEKSNIAAILAEEESKFRKSLQIGLREFDKLSHNSKITGLDLFNLYQSYGFPLEISLEIANEKKLSIDKKELKEYEILFKKHQAKSQTSSAGMFKGGLIDSSNQTVKYHTATHLLHAALRQVLGFHVKQRGSNITKERLRFDFSHPTKITEEELREIEDLVNQQIDRDLLVSCKEISLDKAKSEGALGVFDEKYEDKVKVYSVGDFSKEICGGPHVKSTGLLGKFKITKEESSGAGIRRIKAILV